MENSWYSFDVSPVWVLIVFASALALSVLLYSKKGMPWGRNPNLLLAFLRFSSVFLIILLLLNPLLQLNQNETEKPIVALAIDNSESIPLRTPEASVSDFKAWITQTENELGNSYVLETFYLEENTDTLGFSAKTTNIDQLLRSIENSYEGQNLGAVVLASDGIINQGQSPGYRNYDFPIYSLGLGDTIPPRDIAITDIRSNRVAYQGNQYPVQVNIQQKGFQGNQAAVTVSESGKVLDKQNLTLSGSRETASFFIEAQEPGLKRLTISISPLEGESSTANNRQDVFIDIIEGKEKVLILAPAPHPDIKAIRSVLTEAANYETTLYTPGIHEKPPLPGDFDVVIVHQAFSGGPSDQYAANGKWYILGDRINIGQMSGEINFLKVKPNSSQKDQVRPVYEPSFSKFVLTDNLLDRMSDYPPVSVPFGTYEVTGPAEVLFYQQVGNIATDRPLMVFFDDGTKKQAVQVGTGLWRWKLQEAGTEDEARLFKEYVLKTVQFLSIKANKDRFIVKPRKTDYLVSDRIFIDTEVYNDIYERAYGNTIRLTLTNERGASDSFEMIDSQTNSSFNLGTRPAGVYLFEGSVSLGGKTFTEKGSFAVRDIQLESIELTANHNLLRTLSRNTGGQFYKLEQRDELLDQLINQDFKQVIRTSEQYLPLISSWWIILIIAFLLSAEWTLRKYLGAY